MLEYYMNKWIPLKSPYSLLQERFWFLLNDWDGALNHA